MKADFIWYHSFGWSQIMVSMRSHTHLYFHYESPIFKGHTQPPLYVQATQIVVCGKNSVFVPRGQGKIWKALTHTLVHRYFDYYPSKGPCRRYVQSAIVIPYAHPRP